MKLLTKLKGIKWHWVLVVIWLIIVVVTVLALYKQINNLIQAIAVITLAFITFYYAVQTQKLVEEEKKKRDLDFWEKRIGEFYGPFIRSLGDLRRELSKKDPDGSKVDEINKIIGDCFLWKRYMAPRPTIKAIAELLPYIFQAQCGKDRKYYDQFLEEADKVKEVLKDELTDLEKKIREFYAVENNEEKR